MNIKKFIDNPAMAVLYLGRRGCFNWMNDKRYISLLFKIHFGYWPDIDNPRTYNEKMQWLKLHHRNHTYASLVDKIEVRSTISQMIGEEYLIPLLWSGEKFNDIDFSILPDEFVIKCTHDSGSAIICNDKETFDIKRARRFINKHLNTNLYWAGREWVYKNIRPRIIIERYIGSDVSYPEDYKFYVFNGIIDCVMICKGREKGYPQFYFYDLQWKRLNYLKSEPADDIPRPDNYDEMIEIVKKLSVGYPEVRIDLYDVDGKIYFGEYTFFNQSGYDLDITRKTDEYWGSLLDLSKINTMG